MLKVRSTLAFLLLITPNLFGQQPPANMVPHQGVVFQTDNVWGKTDINVRKVGGDPMGFEVDGTVTAEELIGVTGITLNGVRITEWPDVELVGSGVNLTYPAPSGNGNLAASDNTLGELAIAVDNLTVSGDPGGGPYVGDGSGLTDLNATEIKSGKLTLTDNLDFAGHSPERMGAITIGAIAGDGSGLVDLNAPHVYNIVNYGAIADDGLVGQDQIAIQTCLDLCYDNGGGVVYIPTGTYEVEDMSVWPRLGSEDHSSCLVIRGDNTTIMGDGAGSIIKVSAKDGGGVIWNLFGTGDNIAGVACNHGGAHDDWLGANNIVFRDFTVDGNKDNQNYVADLTQFYEAGNLWFINMTWRNSIMDAIDVASPMLVVEGNYFENLDTAIQNMAHSTTTASFIDGCRFVDCGVSGVAATMDISEGYYHVNNCEFTGANTKWTLNIRNAQPNTFNNCTFQVPDYDAAQCTVSLGGNVAFNQCTWVGLGWTAWTTHTEPWMTAINSTVKIRNCHSGAKSLLAASGTSYVDVRDNYINQTTSSRTDCALYFTGGTDGSYVVSGNTFFGSTYMLTGDGVTGMVVKDNYFTYNDDTYGPHVTFQGAATGNTVKNNVFNGAAKLDFYDYTTDDNFIIDNTWTHTGYAGSSGAYHLRIKGDGFLIKGNQIMSVVFNNTQSTGHRFVDNVINGYYFLACTEGETLATCIRQGNTDLDGVHIDPGAVLNIRDFGALAAGDAGAGGYDNSVAIQAALDACGVGGTVYIPRGDFWVSGYEMEIKHSGTIIRGEGSLGGVAISRISTSHATINVFKNVNKWGVTVQDLEVYNSNKSPSSSSSAFYYANSPDSSTSASRAYFKNVKTIGFFNGFYMNHVTGVTFINCEALGNVNGFNCPKIDAAVWISCFAGDALLPVTRTVGGKSAKADALTSEWVSAAHGFSPAQAVTLSTTWTTSTGDIAGTSPGPATTVYVHVLDVNTFTLHTSSGEGTSGANPLVDAEDFGALAADSTGWWIHQNTTGNSSLANIITGCEGRWADKLYRVDRGFLTMESCNGEHNAGNHVYVGAWASLSMTACRLTGTDDQGEDLVYIASGRAPYVSMEQCQFSDPATGFYGISYAEADNSIAPRNDSGQPTSGYNRTTTTAITLGHRTLTGDSDILVTKVGNDITLSLGDSTTGIKNGLLCWYDFEETSGAFADSHNPNKPARRIASAVTGTANPIQNNYLVASGGGDTVKRGVEGVYDKFENEFTLCAWVKVVTPVSNPELFAVGFLDYNNTYNDTPFQIGYQGNGNNRFGARLNGTMLKADPGAFIGNNVWSFVFAKYDGTTLYVNITDRTATTQLDAGWTLADDEGIHMSNAMWLCIGYPAGGLVQHIDSVGLWNRALTTAEMNTLFASGVGVSYSDL